MRTAEITRKTTETDINLKLCLDGTGEFKGTSGSGFFDHMLTLFARHGRFDITLDCKGDTHVDLHHTVEDTGIVLGEAFLSALSDSRGIKRYGHMLLPMDETLVMSALDIGGRTFLVFDMPMPAAKVGDFDSELCGEFFMALSRSMKMTLHLKLISGGNTHHIIEAAFKGTARALAQAVAIDEKYKDEIPSTKGVL